MSLLIFLSSKFKYRSKGIKQIKFKGKLIHLIKIWRKIVFKMRSWKNKSAVRCKRRKRKQNRTSMAHSKKSRYVGTLMMEQINLYVGSLMMRKYQIWSRINFIIILKLSVSRWMELISYSIWKRWSLIVKMILTLLKTSKGLWFDLI